MVELAITVFVLAILTAFAIPTITSTINASRLTSNANEVVAGMQLARMEAIRRNQRVTFCQSNDAVGCSAVGAGSWTGWIVITDAGEVVRAANFEAPLQVRSSTNLTNNRLVFRADGLAYAGNALLTGNVRVCLPTNTPVQNARDVNIAVGGRLTVRNAANVTVACPRPGNL